MSLLKSISKMGSTLTRGILGGAGKLLGAVFSPFIQTPEMPEIPGAPEASEDPRIKQMEKEEEELRRRIRAGQLGRRSTILTSPLGAPDKAPVTRKTLLGE